ncbi:MAG: radical SAM protein [Oscillospiraceae bacterium]|nr:radical SAM protein [Oscillospiraceae bacterium]
MKTERYIDLIKNVYYDSLKNKLVFSNKDLSKNICCLDHKFSRLSSKTFLEENLKTSRQELILSVTEECNFRCHYCVYHDTKYNADKKLEKMNFDIAKLAIDDYIKHSSYAEKRCIAFYGGEPLKNFSLVKQCVKYVKSFDFSKHMMFLITTNGTLMDEEKVKFLTENKFLINISLDGPKSINDRYRRTCNDENTFERIFESVKKLIDTDKNYWEKHLSFLGVLCPQTDVKSIVDFFEISPFNYFLQDLELTEHMKNKIVKEFFIQENKNTNFANIKLQSLQKPYNTLLNEIRNVRKSFEKPIKNIPFVPGRYCLPALKRLFVSPAGDYYICEKADGDESKIIGNAKNGINYERLDDLKNKSFEFHNENCRSCWAARFCGVCFVTLNKFPKCCEIFKSNVKKVMCAMVEENL